MGTHTSDFLHWIPYSKLSGSGVGLPALVGVLSSHIAPRQPKCAVEVRCLIFASQARASQSGSEFHNKTTTTRERTKCPQKSAVVPASSHAWRS